MTIGRLVILISILAVVSYIGIHLNVLLSAPPLELVSPPPGLTTADKSIEIKGKTIPGATVEINGSPLSLYKSGEFSHLLVLDRGINTITVSARKRHSRTTTIERQVFITTSEERNENGVFISFERRRNKRFNNLPFILLNESISQRGLLNINYD